MAKNLKTCFVIAPIGDESSRDMSDKILRQIIVPAAKETGYTPLRADKISKAGKITPQVIEHLLDDPLVIADLTGHNPIVFYELAIRHATRKPFVQLIEGSEYLPFDADPICTIKLDHRNRESVSQAIKELVAQIRSAEQSSSNAFTPVSIAMQIIHSKMDKVATRSGTRVPRLAVGKFGECKVHAKMTMRLDPYTGQERRDLPLADSIGYFESTEVNGIASGIYDLYASAPGYPQTMIAAQVTLKRAPVLVGHGKVTCSKCGSKRTMTHDKSSPGHAEEHKCFECNNVWVT